jgi:hypothetical protein
MPPVGLPRDPAQWLALLLAAGALAMGHRTVRASPHRARFLLLAAIAAAALSAAYIAAYLRGGPRIIDATSYFLEARALARGLFAWPLSSPATSTLGRFLVRSEGPSGPHIAVIFPPGYPALLAAGFLAGAPLAVGPLLAAAIAWTTYDLAARVDEQPGGAISVPRLAVVFSVLCAALRYHTADTMSHGLAALCSSAALALTLRAEDAHASPRRALALAAGAGLFAGWLVATRPVSGVALAVALVVALVGGGAAPARARQKSAVAIALFAIPGLLLLLAHQRAATGVLGGSSQALYYAVSDGPPGCFRFGFGRGIGCVGEHGDFVRAHLESGFGALAAIGTTLRRLKLHLVDPLNSEPLALLVPIGAWAARKAPRARLLAIAVLAQIAVYVPFYFDGNYPGGGARFFADVLPLEHVLAAIAVARLGGSSRWPRGVIATVLLGFSFRAGVDHAQLRDRDGGRPMFEPDRLARAGIHSGLVFFDTDHGFNLAFDPDAGRFGVQAARLHGDDLDRMIWEARGRPPAFRYRFGIPARGEAPVAIEPLAFQPISEEPLTIEGESLWPPLEQQGGYAMRAFASGTCASAGLWLAVHAEAAENASATKVRVELPAAFTAGRIVSPRVALGPGARGEVVLRAGGEAIHTWRLVGPDSGPPVCLDLDGAAVPEGAERTSIELKKASATEGGEPLFALDRVRLAGKK